MMTEPIKHIAQPNRPSFPNSSFKKYAPKTALISFISKLYVSGSQCDVPDEHAQRTQWRYQYRRSKGICGKVCNFTNDHCEIQSALSQSPVSAALSKTYLLLYQPTIWGFSSMQNHLLRIHPCWLLPSTPNKPSSVFPSSISSPPLHR